MLKPVFADETSKRSLARLLKTFARLSETEQTLLYILAVVYKPMEIKSLDSIVNLLHQRNFLAHPKNNYRLSATRKTLLCNKGLIENSQHGLKLNNLLANTLINQLDNLATKQPRSDKRKFLDIAQAGEEVLPPKSLLVAEMTHYDGHRAIRDILYFGQIERLETILNLHKDPHNIDHARNTALNDVLFSPFNLHQFAQLPNSIAYQAFATLFRTHQVYGKSVLYPIKLLSQVCSKQKKNNTVTTNSVTLCEYLLAEQYLYQKNFDKFNKIVTPFDNSYYALQLLGAYHFLKAEIDTSIQSFSQAISAKDKLVRRKNQYLGGTLAYFYKLALMIKGNREDAAYLQKAAEQIICEEDDNNASNELVRLSLSLSKSIQCLMVGGQYNHIHKSATIDEASDYFCHHLCQFSHLLAKIWCNQHQGPELAMQADMHQARLAELGYPLFADLCAQLSDYFNNKEASNSEELINIAYQVKSKENWDMALDRLIALKPSEQATVSSPTSDKATRLIWELSLGFVPSLKAREQKLNKSGWSKGRVISLKRLKSQTHDFDYLSESDQKICKAIKAFQGYGYYAATEYALEGLPALKAAVGADNVYLEDDLYDPIEIIKQEPELHVNELGSELCLTIPHAAHKLSDGDESSNNFSFSEVSQSRYQLTEFTSEHLKVIEILGDDGLLIPISAKQKALYGIAAIAPLLNIRSNIESLDTGLTTIECDPNLVVNIAPMQQGLAFTCLVMPFGEKGPAFTPGVGNASLSADINGQRLATQRNLIKEQALLDLLDSACPAFLAMQGNSLKLSETQDALEALEQLEIASHSESFDLLLRWPKGKKITLSQKLESQHLQLALHKKPEWFGISGDLHINNEQVLELKRLLELVSTSNGRYIQLDSQQILVLSSDLRDRLSLLNEVSDGGRFHPLASLQVEQATTGMRMKTIDAWDKQTKRMREANEITPSIPSTFQGELRDYQRVGFDWAMRLAHWGAGACLADDMGLGKTLQALCVLLARAEDGPSLIIAPTSVCHNWQQEALRFTPTLNIRLFADAVSANDRQTLLKSLKARDCVIISYGLLQRTSDKLQEVNWHTIVADEAQALKNPLTKRSKAACALKGDFKMITTGTPIENDLTELWSLFRFINPGLLGNLKAFGKRFALPIANAKEDKLAAHSANHALKTMIQPFILRRLKTQVLTELPPRTNINIQVEMGEQEQAFYEALRLNAVDNISKSIQQGHQRNTGEQRIRMLAELVKLRQACCNSQLVMAESNIPSAKLAALEELLVELRLNNHKALIFSQFVGHLQLIKQHIESLGFSYQYLDGSTPQKERQKRVNAFQAGEGDLFLISLKAGGSGLNLTAADYVIHMDPWWNPAVEEQASDRAHRIGQTRPVTIYRLITKNTIEEKIVSLHQSKRDLADNLLAGTELTTKLSVEDMLNLLQKTF